MRNVLRIFLVAIAGAVMAAAPATLAHAALELSLSWNPNTVVDTLVVAEPGTYDCYLLVEPDITETTFGAFWGHILLSNGVAFQGLEGLLDPAGIVSVESEPGNGVLVSVDYTGVCIPYASTLAFAKLTLAIDPAALPDPGLGVVLPIYVENDPASTALTVGSPLCFWFVTPWPCAPAFIRAGVVPNEDSSFGGVKALFR